MLDHANWIVTLIRIMIYVMMCRSNLTRPMSIKSTVHNYIHQYHIILKMNELGRGPTKIITFINVDRNSPLTDEGYWYSFIFLYLSKWYHDRARYYYIIHIIAITLWRSNMSMDHPPFSSIHVPLQTYGPNAGFPSKPLWMTPEDISEWYRASWCFSTSKNLGISGE